jgi:F-type H+-transporting ATPase subunit b
MTRPVRAAAALAVALGAAPAQAAEGGLQIFPDPARLVLLLALFVVLIPILNGLVFRPLLGVLEERERRIEGARTRAGELAEQAGELVARHDSAVRDVRQAANAERAAAVEEARRAHQRALAEARAHAELQMAGTRADVESAVESARSSLRREAEPLAREAAERLLGRRLA